MCVRECVLEREGERECVLERGGERECVLERGERQTEKGGAAGVGGMDLFSSRGSNNKLNL